MLCTYIIVHLNSLGIFEMFYKKELQKPNQKEFRIDKVTKAKSDKLYVKLKGSFKCCNRVIFHNHILVDETK